MDYRYTRHSSDGVVPWLPWLENWQWLEGVWVATCSGAQRSVRYRAGQQPLPSTLTGKFGVELRAQPGQELAAFVGDDFARVESLSGNLVPFPFGANGPEEEGEVVEHLGGDR